MKFVKITLWQDFIKLSIHNRLAWPTLHKDNTKDGRTQQLGEKTDAGENSSDGTCVVEKNRRAVPSKRRSVVGIIQRSVQDASDT